MAEFRIGKSIASVGESVASVGESVGQQINTPTGQPKRKQQANRQQATQQANRPTWINPTGQQEICKQTNRPTKNKQGKPTDQQEINSKT